MSDFALGTDDFAKEQKALETCWQAMRALDTAARDRLLGWLRNWARKEAPNDQYSDSF